MPLGLKQFFISCLASRKFLNGVFIRGDKSSRKWKSVNYRFRTLMVIAYAQWRLIGVNTPAYYKFRVVLRNTRNSGGRILYLAYDS